MQGIAAPQEWVDEFDSFPSDVKTMQDFFLYTDKKFGDIDHIGVIEDGSVKYLTRHDIHKRALAFGSYLLHNGIQKGDTVGVYTENRIESGIILEACHLYGFLSVFTFDTGIPSYPKYTLINAEVKCLYISPAKLDRAIDMFDDGFEHLKFVITNNPVDKFKFPIHLYEDTMKTEVIEPLPEITEDMPSTIIYSSGTVSAPKGVVISNKAMLTGVLYIMVSVPVKYGDVHVSYLPMAHILERIGYLIFQLRGAKIVFTRKGVLSAIEDMAIAGVTGGPIIPSVMKTIHDKMFAALNDDTERDELAKAIEAVRNGNGDKNHPLFLKCRNVIGGKLDWFAVAGDVFDKKIHSDLCIITGAQILPIYGLSECAGPVSVTPVGAISPGTVGRLCPYVELKFGERNEILIKTPALFTEYWRNPEVTREAFTEDGWYRTGDRGSVDPESGHLIVSGRAYDIFEFQPGVELALPFLRFTYRDYILVKDIFLVPYEKRGALMGIVVVEKYIAEHYVSRQKEKLSDEQFAEVCKQPGFVQYIIQNTNKFGEDNCLREGSALAAIRCTPESFTVENGLVTLTGKMRVPALMERYKNEIEDMKKEIEEKYN